MEGRLDNAVIYSGFVYLFYLCLADANFHGGGNGFGFGSSSGYGYPKDAAVQ